MSGKTMDERVTDLEKLAESLAPLPARMEAVEGRLGVVEMRLSTVGSQIVQLRTEMRDEFSALRGDLKAYSTKDDLRAFATKDDLRAFATKDDLRAFATKQDLEAFATKEELRAAIAPLATRPEMRMLHEDLVERIKAVGEAWARPGPRARKKH